MKIGKLPAEQLHALVLGRLGKRRDDVLLRPAVGEDSAVIDFGDEVCVISSDPITGAGARLGELAVHVSCNDIAANGARPVGVQVVLLLPESFPEVELAVLMEHIDKAAGDLGIEVLGGHTEITSKVREPLIVVTALGRAPRHGFISSSGARPGDDLVISKGISIEGTAILASDFAALLRPLVGEEVIARSQEYWSQISVVPEGRIGAAHGVSAMHDVTEGGLYGALWEMAEASKAGLAVWRDRVPIREETALICQHLGLDPLGLISSGTMLFATPRGEELVDALAAEGIEGAIIGQVTDGPRVIHGRAGEERILEGPGEDELWRFLKTTS
ncbi:MAG: AIR synthase family protein [Limnochordia bacterium]|nr:AIR synthase [Bacillota bacterium]